MSKDSTPVQGSFAKMLANPITYCLVLLAVALSSSCERQKATKNASPKHVFHYNQINGVTSLDPAFARSQTNIWAVSHLFNGLVQLDEDLQVQPCIAKSWEVSEDGLTYTFHLRGDIYFHDNEAFTGGVGRKVVAHDVVFSFNRIIDTVLNSPGSWIFNDRVATAQPFSAPNDSTFFLRLQKPFRPMMGILTMQYCSVVPKEAVTHYGKAFRSQPVGTGPFRFKRWLEGQALFLLKNDNYFEYRNGQRLPYLDGVRVSFIPDRKTAYLELINDRLDFMSGLESSIVNELLTPEGLLQPKQREILQFIKSPFLNTEYLGINMQLEAGHPLRNKLIRQALNYGIDRAQMLRSLRNSVGQPARSGFTPTGLPSFDPQAVPGYRYDPDKARALLAEAGFPNGKGLPSIKLMTNKDYLDLCTFITRHWEDIGVKVEIDVLESATLRQMMRKSQAPFFRASWIADYPDAESFLSMFYSKNPAPPNYTRFSNAAFDGYYERALNENNDSLRYDLYHKMERILVEEAPVIFLFYDETSLFARRDIENISKNAINLLELSEVKEH